MQLLLGLHRQLPDVVLVVAGDSATQNELAALVTDGTIYRFVHKTRFRPARETVCGVGLAQT
ncbi:MAG: hypothetical protein WDM77_00880 [Steroidobacteraceae bacterium]